MMADQIQHQNEVPHVEYIVCLCGFFPSHHIIFTKHKASHIFRIYSVANRCTDWEKGAGLFRNNETCYESFWIMSAIFWRILCKIRKMIQPKSSPIPHHTHTLVSYKLLSVIVATPFLALAETYSSFFSISSNLYLYVKVKALLWTACVRMCGYDIVLSFNFDTLHLEFHFSFLILRKVVLLNRYNDKLNKMVLAKDREREKCQDFCGFDKQTMGIWQQKPLCIPSIWLPPHTKADITTLHHCQCFLCRFVSHSSSVHLRL